MDSPEPDSRAPDAPVPRATGQAVAKALRLLQALDRYGSWIGVRELSRLLQFSPPATHNLLKTLQAANFVEANPESRQYRLGLAAVRLGAGSDPLQHMRRFARPYIETLAEKSDETIVVLAWLHDQAVVVDWIQAGHTLAVTHHHGMVEHPMVFASGRVLLAWQEREVRQRHALTVDYAKLGENSPRNPDELLALLERVVAEGYALTENVGQSGVVAIGAPVFDANDRLLLAVGCSAPISRTTPAQLAEVRARLLEVTAEMSRRLRAPEARPAPPDLGPPRTPPT